MTTVDRRAVQALSERWRAAAKNGAVDASAKFALLACAQELDVAIHQSPSGNAQAVAFDDAAILRALHAWFEDPKATHDLPESFKKRMRCAIRALCVCYGDAKEA